MKKQIAYMQKLFFDLWNDFGSVYLLVRYSDRSRIGRRGFTDEEKEQGLVLVFNNLTNARIEWDEEGNVTCELAFGSRREDVYLHHDDLRGVFSPEAQVQFIRSDADAISREAPDTDASRQRTGKVVSLSSFKNKQK
jgi:hypothetical protein